MQTTLSQDLIFDGIGVHTGAPARLVIRPAQPNAGIIITRVLESGEVSFPATLDYVLDSRLGTTLGRDAQSSVMVTEHALSALYGLGVDNAQLVVDGPEMPVMDGSAEPFAKIIAQDHLVQQSAPRRFIEVVADKPFEHGASHGAFEPAEFFELAITVDYEDPAIGAQRYEGPGSGQVFLTQIAPARTFGYAAELDAMRAAGRGQGASLENAVAFQDGKVLNPEGMRFPDEPVRHKALDAVGDLALAGAPIRGRFRAHRPGHAVNAAALRALLADTSAWRWSGNGD